MSLPLSIAPYVFHRCCRSSLTALPVLLLLGAPVRLSAYAAAAQSIAGQTQSATATAFQSDPAAIQAMQNVMAQSGGAAAWQNLRSAKEVFSIVRPPEEKSRVQLLLDDWSLDTARYRRAVKGQTTPPPDHNGVASFPVKVGNSQRTLPEFDQARTLVRRLPAASAEIMLRRREYILRINKWERCESGSICGVPGVF